MIRRDLLLTGLILLFFGRVPSPLWADKVITKDGKVYTGKILLDSDKAVLIGNPPLDPNSTLIEAKDIKTIVYEEYRGSKPAERRRSVNIDLQLAGNAYSSKELGFYPSAGLSLGGGFRFHPLIEIGGALQWTPQLEAHGEGLAINSGTTPPVIRGYQSFWQYGVDFLAKLYPFYRKTKWTTEPYVITGYGFSRLIPKGSGDSFEGDGWTLGAGAVHPISTHVFLDGRFTYQSLTFDKVNFLGNEASISPQIAQHIYRLSIGASYRF